MALNLGKTIRIKAGDITVIAKLRQFKIIYQIAPDSPRLISKKGVK